MPRVHCSGAPTSLDPVSNHSVASSTAACPTSAPSAHRSILARLQHRGWSVAGREPPSCRLRTVPGRPPLQALPDGPIRRFPAVRVEIFRRARPGLDRVDEPEEPVAPQVALIGRGRPLRLYPTRDLVKEWPVAQDELLECLGCAPLPEVIPHACELIVHGVEDNREGTRNRKRCMGLLRRSANAAASSTA